ncbi:hypothetical protein [Tautonia sociabilis]|uniref:YHS domain-containing protein n=1 Tax=Tautonia sociabilis TaxID=2080755 RepID=A0A432ME84_9BACT|nr:hypothetical protein [Tautonia sociabilis]RUL83560.1 hypothetical protein TsocGM_21890 [Tautonia sociabilis]
MASLVLALGTTAAADDGPVADKSRVCMVQDAVMDKPGIPVERGGKTYYGCCAMCSEMIAKEPERLTRAQDPVTGADVDKADALVFGLGRRAYYFESESSRARFAKNPALYVSPPDTNPR